MSQVNKFTNANVEPWYKWLFRKNETLQGATIYFLSKKNPTSPRFFWLYEHSHNVRIVLFRGLRIGKLDIFILLFVRYFSRIASYKFKKYLWVHLTDGKATMRVPTNSIVHMDDPTYNLEELSFLNQLLQLKQSQGFGVRVIVTNHYTQRYVESKFPSLEVFIVQQGFHSHKSSSTQPMPKFEDFSVVYASPNIHYKGDRYGEHTAWGSIHLIDTLIPQLASSLPNVKVHLIGNLGEEAKKKLNPFSNVICHGWLSTKECTEVLKRCHVGIYPRTHDHKRSVQKITEYLGAYLPIVAYDLIDVSIVKELCIGVTVSTSDEFVQVIEDLASNAQKLEHYISNVKSAREYYSWENLASRMDLLYTSGPKILF